MSASERDYAVFGFATTHDALAAEAALVGSGVTLTVMPTPKALGALCGIALRVPAEDAAWATGIMAEARITPSGSITMLDR